MNKFIQNVTLVFIIGQLVQITKSNWCGWTTYCSISLELWIYVVGIYYIINLLGFEFALEVVGGCFAVVG